MTDMEIVNKQIAYNRTPRSVAPEYIVIHDTGNRSNGADAAAHYSYFNGDNRGSSADIFIDDRSIWVVNDYTKYYTWHCGDGKGQYGISNYNSVGVEICINADGDYSKALENTASYVRTLAQELSIPLTHVVRHYDASRKNCPASMSGNNWQRWRDFLVMLGSKEPKKELSLQEQVDELRTRMNALTNPMIYNYIDDNMPEWARDSVKWAVDNGIIQGDGRGLSLDDNKLWTLVVVHRAFEKLQK